MSTSPIFIAISVVVLIVVVVLVFFVKKGKKESKLTPLAGLAFVCILAGILFGGEQLVGYALLGVGVILAIIDMIGRFRSR